VEGETFEEWTDNFIGNTQDFLDALNKAFKESLIDFAKTRFELDLEIDDATGLLRFCLVHFKRSCARIWTNNAVIPMKDKDKFKDIINDLLDLKSGQFTEFTSLCRKFGRNHKNAVGWLKWHIHPNRGPHLFKACQDLSKTQWDKLKKDTNAQENVGKQFQDYSTPIAHPQVGECIVNAHGFCHVFHADRIAVRAGQPICHGFFSKPNNKIKK